MSTQLSYTLKVSCIEAMLEIQTTGQSSVQTLVEQGLFELQAYPATVVLILILIANRKLPSVLSTMFPNLWLIFSRSFRLREKNNKRTIGFNNI